MEAINTLRLKMYLTQTGFGDLFGVAYGTVNRWEFAKNSPRLKIKRQMLPYFKEYNIDLELIVNYD